MFTGQARGLLRANVEDGREVLGLLLVDKLRFTPIGDERRRGYQFEGAIALDRLITGVVELPAGVASPTAFGDGCTLEATGNIAA